MKGSLVILSFFSAGILLGVLHLLPGSVDLSGASMGILCLLMALVGFSVGNNPDSLKNIRKLDRKVMLLPLMTLLGTFLGCTLAWFLVRGTRLSDLLAIGSGFGYYSLSSILISESRGVALGTLALLSNIIREVMALLMAPLLKTACGPLAPIAAGGATTADTTLPVISSVCGERYTVISIYHGFIVDFSVPFLVTFFCAL